MYIEQDRIEKIVELSAPVSKVWNAITDHVQFGEWFRVRLDGPFEVGAVTTGNITYEGYEHIKWISTTEEMTPESRFVFTWPPSAVDPDTEYVADAKVTVVFELEPAENGTRLTITESGFPAVSGNGKRLGHSSIQRRGLGHPGQKI